LAVNITPVNDPPVSSDNTVSTFEDVPYVFHFNNAPAPNDFGFADPTDAPGSNSLLNVKLTTAPTQGVITDNGQIVTAGQLIPVADITGGLVQYQPVANHFGPSFASFTFQVQDNGGVNNS